LKRVCRVDAVMSITCLLVRAALPRGS